MRDYTKVFSGKFFTCDRCGRTYSFSNAYLTVKIGETYTRADGTREVAECDLCRGCAGQTEKFLPGVEARLQAEIALIDANRQREVVDCLKRDRGLT